MHDPLKVKIFTTVFGDGYWSKAVLRVADFEYSLIFSFARLVRVDLDKIMIKFYSVPVCKTSHNSFQRIISTSKQL